MDIDQAEAILRTELVIRYLGMTSKELKRDVIIVLRKPRIILRIS